MPTKGEMEPLSLLCLVCKKLYPTPLKEFATGTVICGNVSTPHKFTIPNNTRYYRLIDELDSTLEPTGVVRGLIQVRTEPYLVRYALAQSSVTAFHVDTLETRQVARGHYAGKGQMLGWDGSVNGDLGAEVLRWLHTIGNEKLTN